MIRITALLLILRTTTGGTTTGAFGEQVFHFTGKYAVSRQVFVWTDVSRQEDASIPDRNPRHVVASVFYPAASAGKSALYFPGLANLSDAHALAALKAQFGKSWDLVRSGGIQMEVTEDQPAAEGRFPVLVFSPGLGVPALTYSLQLGELASHGFIVFALDHPYDVAAVQLPDGKVILEADRHTPDGPPNATTFKADAERENVWVSDTQFAVGQIHKINAEAGTFREHLDLSKIGLFGHSMGGRVAVKGCQMISGIGACLNEDGGLFGVDFRTGEVVPLVIPNASTKGALLNIDVPFHPPPEALDVEARKGFAAWQSTKAKVLGDFLTQNKKATYSAVIERSEFNHGSFMDVRVLGAGDEERARALADLSLVQRLIVAFFESTLKREPSGFRALLEEKIDGVTMQKIH